MGQIDDFDQSWVEESAEFSEADADFCLQMWKRTNDKLVKESPISDKLDRIFYVTLHEIEEDTTGQKQEKIKKANCPSDRTSC